MIGKVDPKHILDLRPLAPSPSSPAPENLDFRSVLKERLADSKPLELMMIEFLSRTIEQFLSKTEAREAREDDFFVAPPFSFNRTVVPSLQRGQQAFQPQHVHQGDNRVALESSNNLQAWQDPVTNGIDDIIEEASQKYGVEPGLIKAVISVESGGNPNALSPAGAQGLMQLMPKTAAELGVSNPLDPAENIMAGTRYLRQLLDRYWGNVRLALAAYNWGMGNLEKRPDAMPKETKNYIVKVENLYRTHLAASL
jgi:soluble lytic murein transglycosylase-like protein